VDECTRLFSLHIHHFMTKSSLYLILFYILIYYPTNLSSQTIPCQGPNLWYNGTFEQSNDLLASGWNPFCLPPFYDVITSQTPGFLYPDIEDHTPGSGGQFLWSDHSLTPCVFFPIGSDVNILTQQLPTVIGETYHFGVWAYAFCLNVNAEFGLAIDGTVVLTQNLNNIPNCTKGWKYFSYDWVATETLTDFGIIDVNWQLFGWDMAFDDIEVYQLPDLEITTSADTTICAGACVPVWVKGEAIESVIWTGGVANPTTDSTSACPTINSQYTVIAQDTFGCLDTAMIAVTVNPAPMIDLGEDLIFCPNDCDTLTTNLVVPTTNQTILWSTGATTPFIEVCHGSDSKIIVTVTQNDCQIIDSVNVTSILSPTISLVSVTCASDFLTYQLVFSTQNSNTSIVSEGVITQLGGNIFLVKNIDINNSITIEASQDGLCPITLTVDPPSCSCPDIPAPISGGDVEICFNDPITSLAVSTIAGTKVNWYVTQTGGNPIANLTNTFLPTQVGTYYAEAIDTVNNCISNTRTAVKLTKRPEVIANAGENIKICENTCTPLIATGGLTYLWNNGFTTASISACPLIDTHYKVTVSDAAGCTDVDSVLVNIEPFPVVNLQIPTCEPNLLTWNILTIPNINTKYNASVGTVSFSGNNSFLIKNIPTGTNCTLFIETLNGICKDTIEILAPECECPLIQPPASPGEYIICANKPFPNFNVTVGAGLKADWYANPTGGTPLLQNSTTFLPTQAGTYYAESRDPINGCVSAVRSPVILTLLPLPSINLPDTLAISCGMDNTILEATNASSGSNFTPQWTFPNGVNPVVLNGNPLKLEVNMGGIYSLKIKNSLTQCEDTDTTLVLKTNVPTASFELEQPVCFGEMGILKVISVENGLPPYQFSIDGGLTFFTDSVVSDIAPNTYNFVVKDATDCANDSIFNIRQPQEIGLALDSSVTILLGNNVQLFATLDVPFLAIDSLFWQPAEGLSCTNCLIPTAKPIESKTYTITVKDLQGCTEIDSIEVKISRQVPTLYAPNALYTESDAGNDYFTIFGREGLIEKINTLHIWNRWGELVFEQKDFVANNPDLGWNGSFRGRRAPEGVYAWWAEVLLIDGTKIEMEGEITVVY
jgi:hypothetical protein